MPTDSVYNFFRLPMQASLCRPSNIPIAGAVECLYVRSKLDLEQAWDKGLGLRNSCGVPVTVVVVVVLVVGVVLVVVINSAYGSGSSGRSLKRSGSSSWHDFFV